MIRDPDTDKSAPDGRAAKEVALANQDLSRRVVFRRARPGGNTTGSY